MANVRVIATLRNARLDALKTAIDAGAGNGLIKFYDGTQPATGDTGLSGNTLLGTLTMAKPSAPSAASGVLTFNSITQDSAADANGTASWARVSDSSGNTVFDCDVGTSGATININNITIIAGGPIVINSFTLTDSAS